MEIIVKDIEKQELELVFTDEDTENMFFNSTILKVLGKYEGELLGNVLRITPTENQQKTEISILVNDVRQDFMGDLPGLDVPENCPRLGFTPEPEPEEFLDEFEI